MSDSQTHEEIAVSSEGIEVIKRFEEDEFPVPAIAFEFTSTRENAVSVRLTDRVPDGIDVDDLGFHPEYGSEYWTVDESGMTFEKMLDPDEEYTTVYGIRATGTDDIEQFLTEPVIDRVDPPVPEDEQNEPLPDDGSSDDDASDAPKPGHSVSDSGDGTDGDEEDVATLDLKDPSTDNDGPEPPAEPVESPGGTVVGAIAEEIRQEEAAADDLELLQRAIDELDDAPETGEGATAARLDRLQSDIADLRAYTDALEAFLDENGTGEQIIEEFDSRLERFSSDLDELREEVTETAETVEAVGSSVSDLQETVEALEASVADIEEELQDGNVTERVEEVESEVDELRSWQEQIRSTFGG
jgi:FtsZ-binding cell division protein ZapB